MNKVKVYVEKVTLSGRGDFENFVGYGLDGKQIIEEMEADNISASEYLGYAEADMGVKFELVKKPSMVTRWLRKIW